MMITSYTTTAKTPDFRLRRKYRHIRLPQRDTLSSAVINYSDLDRITPIGGGVGGTIVYKVLHRPTNKLYALKAIHSQVEDDEILTQTKIFRDRDHPNLLKCHNVFNSRQDGTHILLEYMDAGSLENAHVHSESALSDLALQILSGLHYLHKRKIVHRDIKPSNLLVNSRNNVKIADFGSESRRNLVSLGMISYMSPERIDAPLDNISRGEYDGCAEDIWSFGVCILEFYLGISPYDHFVKEGDWASLMRAICASEPPSALETASGEFCDFIGCCLMRDPAMRWTTKELLKHPFILRYSPRGGRSGNILTFFRKASKCFHCGLRGYEV